MGLENATYIGDLNESNPVGGDARSQGDDHIRQMKAVMKRSIPHLNFEIVADFTAANVPSSNDIVFVWGYNSIGDGGDGIWKREASQPGHEARLQSADGAWWSLVPEDGVIRVDQLGAYGDDLQNDLTAIQNAIDAARTLGCAVGFSANKTYKISGTISMRDYTRLVGLSNGIAPADIVNATGVPKLIFDGSGTACIDSFDPLNSLLYASISNLAIRVETGYSWALDLVNPVDCTFENIRISTVNASTGGFRSTRLSGESTWVNRMRNVQIRLLDASTARTFQIQWSDSRITDSSFTGGIGGILTGAGAVSCLGCRFDRAIGAAGAAALTIDNTDTPDYPHSHLIIGCEIEESDVGILVYAETQDKPRCMPFISGCHFRCPNETDIKLNNATGQVALGPIITQNVHTLTSARRINWDPDRWLMPWPTPYVWKRETANPIASVTGTTSVTVMKTIQMKARQLGQYGGIRVTSLWELSNDTYDKYLFTYIGLTQMGRFAVTADNQRAAYMVCEIWNQGASPASQCGFAQELYGPGSSPNAILNATVNTDADFTIDLRAQPFNTAATIELRHYNVEVLPG